MTTVQHLVEGKIKEKPFLEEALGRGIVNNAALAESLMPEIEKELGKKVKFSAVNMAVRRFGEKLNGKEVRKINLLGDVLVQSNLVEINLYKDKNAHEAIKKIYSLINFNSGDFLTITEGINEIMIVTNSKHEKKILGMVGMAGAVKKVISGIGSLTVRIPERSYQEMGLFYVVTKELNWENINIVDIVSTLSEMTFILKEDDIPRAYKTITEMMKR